MELCRITTELNNEQAARKADFSLYRRRQKNYGKIWLLERDVRQEEGAVAGTDGELGTAAAGRGRLCRTFGTALVPKGDENKGGSLTDDFD